MIELPTANYLVRNRGRFLAWPMTFAFYGFFGGALAGAAQGGMSPALLGAIVATIVGAIIGSTAGLIYLCTRYVVDRKNRRGSTDRDSSDPI